MSVRIGSSIDAADSSNKQESLKAPAERVSAPSDARQTVLILGPPWPRSGTGRVMESQIKFYRDRGYQTIFIAVPFQQNYESNSPTWNEIREGLEELGADHTLRATIEPREFKLAKYSATLRYGFRGTVLDWFVEIGRVGHLTGESMCLLKNAPIALLHVNHVFTVGFAHRLMKRLGSHQVPIIVETHDIQSQMLLQKQEPNPWFRRVDPVKRLLKSEVVQLGTPDAFIHLSSSDFDFFREELPRRAHFLVFPTIDEDFIAAVKRAPLLAEQIDLLFVADWHTPNLQAVQWFAEQVWPFLADRNYKVKVVGRIGRLVEGKISHLYEKFRAWFVGEVADLAPYYRSAQCVIAPMRSGSGISIKTIEAFALGKAFVGTSKAFRGMPIPSLKKLGIVPFDPAAEFANAILSTLDDVETAESRSRAAYMELFTKEISAAVRNEALAAALKRSPQH